MKLAAFLVIELLIPLHGLDNQVIWVNPKEIISVRQVREKHRHNFGAKTMCVLQTVDGKFISVTDNCDDVRRMINDQKG